MVICVGEKSGQIQNFVSSRGFAKASNEVLQILYNINKVSRAPVIFIIEFHLFWVIGDVFF